MAVFFLLRCMSLEMAQSGSRSKIYAPGAISAGL